jgi:diketogulonate reductase-like aldo/keto reductase
VIVLPKSHRKEGQMENIDIFDFQLTDKESEVISKL